MPAANAGQEFEAAQLGQMTVTEPFPGATDAGA
jgi:hypothetical protein